MSFDNTPLVVELGRAEDSLKDWSGEAAQAFKDRLEAIGNVHLKQQTHLERALLHATALLSLTMTTRQSYVDLASETIGAIDAEIGLGDKRRAKLFVAIGSDVVRDALSMDASKLLTGAISMMVGVAKNLMDYAIDGSGLDEILEKYQSAGTAIREQHQAGLATLTESIENGLHDLPGIDPMLSDPLPVTTDIHSPNFDYSHFVHSTVPESEFSPRVDKEKERMAAEEESQESEINRRLRGAS